MNTTTEELLLSGFQTESLVRTMAPIDLVLASLNYQNHPRTSRRPAPHENREESSTWESYGTQQRLAEMIILQWRSSQGVTRRYLKKLVLAYVSKIEASDSAAIASAPETSDELMEAMALTATPPSQSFLNRLKVSACFSENDPYECGYISFLLESPDKQPNVLTNLVDHDGQTQSATIKIRVFPQHNDVAVMKVWEAGASLAEYFMDQPHLVAGKRVVELGAGVGFTGLILSGLCGCDHVQMTDYTDACLENLQHNIQINREWLKNQRQQTGFLINKPFETLVASSYLEWESYAKGADASSDVSHGLFADSHTVSLSALADADILIGADICYIFELIPSLVKSILRFLSLPSASSNPQTSKCAFLATTLRNKTTFGFFESRLLESGIICEFVNQKELDCLPRIFPVYFVQPRSDIRICKLTLRK